MREKVLSGALLVATVLNVLLFISFLRNGAEVATPPADAAALATADALSVDSPIPTPVYGSAPIRQVALVRILANPHDFDGQRLDVEGYVGFTPGVHGGLFLYANSTDAAFEMTSNSIALDYGTLDPKQLEGACFVEGIFRVVPAWLPFGGSLQVERIARRQRVESDGGGQVVIHPFLSTTDSGP